MGKIIESNKKLKNVFWFLLKNQEWLSVLMYHKLCLCVSWVVVMNQKPLLTVRMFFEATIFKREIKFYLFWTGKLFNANSFVHLQLCNNQGNSAKKILNFLCSKNESKWFKRILHKRRLIKDFFKKLH